MDHIDRLIRRRDRARQRFATLGDLRPGTLNEYYRKCGKPGCHCAEDGDPGHGPGYVLNRSVGGKRSTVRIRPDEVDETRDLLREFRRFREIAEEFLEASEALAEARRSGAGEGDRQKGGRWRRGSPPRRPPRSGG